MADTYSLAPVLAVMTLNNAPPAELTQVPLSTETFYEGELVTMTAGQLIYQSSATFGAVYGVAKSRSSRSTINNGEIPVWLAVEGTLFEGNMVTGSGSSDYVITAADIGVRKGIVIDSTNRRFYIRADVGDGTSARVFVHKLSSTCQLGDTNARVLFSILGKFSQAAGTS